MADNYRVLNGIKFILKSYTVNKKYNCTCYTYQNDKRTHKITCPYKGHFSGCPTPKSCVVTEFCFTVVNASLNGFFPSERSFFMVDTGGNVYNNAHRQICGEFDTIDTHDYEWTGFVSPILSMTKAKINIYFPEIPDGRDVAYLIYKNETGSIQFDFNSVDFESDPDFYLPPILQNLRTIASPYATETTDTQEPPKPSRYIDGYRNDLSINVRSSWEANFARVLRLLHIPFVYEKEVYEFEYQDYKNRRRMTHYLPDFFIQPCNRTRGKEIIVEVKGNWDTESRIKVREYQKETSLPELYIVDYDMYYTISKRYANIVPCWESLPVTKQVRETVQMVGINHEGRQEASRKLFPGAKVNLVREPDNIFDKNAIKVYSDEGMIVGYIASDWASIYARKMDIGMLYSDEVTRIESTLITIHIRRTNVEDDILYDFLSEKE